MTEVKRYFATNRSGTCQYEEDNRGGFVLYTDYQSLEAECGGCQQALAQSSSVNLKHELALIEKINNLHRLLNAAKCPACDGSGAIPDGEGGAYQCQWCYERDEALEKTNENES